MIAIMTAATTNVAATNVLRLSASHVSLTQSLGLDAGSQHFARKKAVAAKVSGEKTYHQTFLKVKARSKPLYNVREALENPSNGFQPLRGG